MTRFIMSTLPMRNGSFIMIKTLLISYMDFVNRKIRELQLKITRLCEVGLVNFINLYS